MSTFIIDWLGRGGIAQCAESWAIELDAAGQDVVVATRSGRELVGSGFPTVEAGGGGRLAAHRRLAVAIASAIEEQRPQCVVIQNFLIPAMEERVHRAARRVGARVVFVIHDHQHHTRMSGNHLGLTGQMRRADTVLAHSAFVAEHIERRSGVTPALLPVPVQLGMLRLDPPAIPVLPDAPLHRAVHFGVLARRSTKGTDIAVDVARAGVPGWEFAFLGVGAPTVPGSLTVDRFLDAAEMVQAVRGSAASLFPYRMASQSGAVVLAQVLGSVPVATRVGGMSEQIEHGQTGVLIDAAAPPSSWARTLQELDGADLDRIGRQATDAAWANHRRFAELAVRAVTG